MTARRKRSEVPSNPATLVRGLRTCREQIIRDVMSTCRPFGPAYRAGNDVIRAIDAIAELLTGEKGYFCDPGHGASGLTVERWREWIAWERGEGPRPS